MLADTERNISVPERFMAEVELFIDFLKFRDGGENENKPLMHTNGAASDTKADYELWADEEVARFISAGTATSRHYIAIMNAIIENNRIGEWVSIAELSEMTGLKYSVISTFRTHMYRYIRSNYGEGRYAPFTAAWGPDLMPKRDKVVYYRVSEQCAQQWHRVAGTAQ